MLENRNRLRVVPRQKVRTVVARIHFLLRQSLQSNKTSCRAESYDILQKVSTKLRAQRGKFEELESVHITRLHFDYVQRFVACPRNLTPSECRGYCMQSPKIAEMSVSC